ncbi:hypothetical protein GCM10022419_059710 [Nonomuraea rosea]|uniref:DUF541 domain-containing protein n=2 Tax=Nonomuraea rosea TaxID=638574 RepID=A0ABP6XVY0_9ACTN
MNRRIEGVKRMAVSRGRSYLNSRVVRVIVRIAVSMAAVLFVVGLGAAPLYSLFEPDVDRVDPAALSELESIGQVVVEDGATGHVWENSYVELKYIVVHIDDSVKRDILAEAEQRLHRGGWRVRNRDLSDIDMKSARWPHAFVSVEPLAGAVLSSELREAAAATGLPMDEMVYITVTGWASD